MVTLRRKDYRKDYQKRGKRHYRARCEDRKGNKEGETKRREIRVGNPRKRKREERGEEKIKMFCNIKQQNSRTTLRTSRRFL